MSDGIRADVRGYAAANRIIYTRHASIQMGRRQVPAASVRHCLMHVVSVAAGDNGKWVTRGPDLDGEELTVVVVVSDGLLIVTLF